MSHTVKDIADYIREHNGFVISSHARPDGDAIGSVLGLGQMLARMGKHFQMVMRDPVPVIYRELPLAQMVNRVYAVSGKYDNAIILECDSTERTGLTGFENKHLINIDHHSTAREFANLNWIDRDAAATGEMIYGLAVELGVEVTPEMAQCLYTAILTDTGSFAYPGTTERTFALAQQLVKAGANPVTAAQNVFFSVPGPKMRLLGAALSTLAVEGQLAWMYVTRYDMERCQALDEDTEGLVNYALGIAGIEVALFFREQADRRFRVSLRSKGRFNVATTAEQFGGGGHPCAAGCSLDGPLSSAVDRIMTAIRNAQFPASFRFEPPQHFGNLM